MKFIKRIFQTILFLILTAMILAYVTGHSYLIRAVWVTYMHGHKTAFLDDYKYFDNDTLKIDQPQPWAITKDFNSVSATKALDSTHKVNGTVAYLIIKNDSIWYESYYDGYGKDSKSNSFSMAKSLVTMAMGKAIMEGKIPSLETPVMTYFKEFSDELGSKMTVGDLSSMASGLDWDEKYYSPFSRTTQLYFDSDLNQFILDLKMKKEPGTVYEYSSGATQLLAMCVEKAVGMPLTKYVSEKFWKPLGCEHEGLWQTDKEGLAKAYCCVASNARDFARFGKLYKQNGKWNGQQVLDSTFVQKCITARFPESPQYGYGWWLFERNGKKGYYMRGHLGQFVAVIPQDDLIMVRLGHRVMPTPENDYHSKDFYVYLDEAYRMLSQRK